MAKNFPLSSNSGVFDVINGLDFLREEGWAGLQWFFLNQGGGMVIDRPGVYLVRTNFPGDGTKLLTLAEPWSSSGMVAVVDVYGNSDENPIVIRTASGVSNEGRDWAISVPHGFMRFISPDGDAWRTVDEAHNPRSEGILDPILLAEHRVLRSLNLSGRNALSLTDSTEPHVEEVDPGNERISYL